MEEKRSCDNPCVCPKLDCAHHGKCCECVAMHRKNGGLPTCLRQGQQGELRQERNA